MPTLGQVIKSLREQSAVSRNALARAAHIDPSILTRLEQGDRDNVRLQTLCKIAEALEVSLDDLAGAAGYFSKRRSRTQLNASSSIPLRESLQRIERLASEALAEPKRRR